MTDTIPVSEVDDIQSDEAMRPWSMNEMTVNETGDVQALHRRVDSVFVPWGVQEPVDAVDAVFTVDPMVIERREGESLESTIGEVVDLIEDDPRLDEYVIWEQLTPSAEAAEIDGGRTRVRVKWRVGGDGE